MIRPALHLLLAVTLGLALIYVLRPRPLLAMLTAAAVPFVLIFIGGWFVTQYKYVRLSAAGICGRPVAGFKPQAVSWEEPLSVTATSLPGLKGHTFTSSTSGASIFVPLPILRSQLFQAAVAQHAPSSHVLRTTEF